MKQTTQLHSVSGVRRMSGVIFHILTTIHAFMVDDFPFTFAIYCYTVVVFETVFQSVCHQFDKRNMSNLRTGLVSQDYSQ